MLCLPAPVVWWPVRAGPRAVFTNGDAGGRWVGSAPVRRDATGGGDDGRTARRMMARTARRGAWSQVRHAPCAKLLWVSQTGRRPARPAAAAERCLWLRRDLARAPAAVPLDPWNWRPADVAVGDVCLVGCATPRIRYLLLAA